MRNQHASTAGTPGGDPLGPSDGPARARSALLAAELADTPAERYLQAHLAALRVAAIVLAARARAVPGGGGRRNVWQLVGEVAPELSEWAGYFAATQVRRQSVAAGTARLVTSREADDLLRDAQSFHDTVVRRLGSVIPGSQTG